MTGDWLLVETLGEEPVVVAQGRQMKNFVPIGSFLRRNPNLAAIQTAIAETVESGSALASITPKTKRVIRTEPVAMPDGRIHGVHVWCGPPDADPAERPAPGAYKADLNIAEASVTEQFLSNVGKDPAVESLTGRSLAEDIPDRNLNEGEAKALSWTIDLVAGRTFAANWGWIDQSGTFRRVGFCFRTVLETVESGEEHLMARSMNIVESVGAAPAPSDHLAHRILEGLAQPGVYRGIVDLENWTLLKWLDGPCPYYNWRGRVQMHPDDYEHYKARVIAELETGSASAVLRLGGNEGEWVPLHITLSRMELDNGVYGGLMLLRLPSSDELYDAGLDPAEQAGSN
ncbi:MAG: GAF domain-containing protein [Mycobacteriaceae bacterium]